VSGARVEATGEEPFTVRASVVVNAAGVWADDVRSLDEGSDPHSIRPAKGIHVTVPREAFPCDIAAVIPVRRDHRSIFVVSWGEQVYLGTTDTQWDGPLDAPDCTPEDVDYLLEAANAVTTKPLSPSDITGIWSGLRPLLAPVAGKRAPSERTADLSRRHTVRTSPSGVVTVTGGKLTTYRKMAEDTVDAAIAVLGVGRRRCVTKNLRLHGAPAGQGPHRADRAAHSGEPAPADPASSAATHLAGRYGTETPAVLAVAEGRPELLAPLVPGLPYLGAEALYAVRAEMACTVSDILDRRTRARLRDARGAAAAAPAVAGILAAELGWGRDRVASESASYADVVSAGLAKAGLDANPPRATAATGHGSDRG
jgi:glycerol-3-phosphate dehydrogenase